jgi:hypothetical protein
MGAGPRLQELILRRLLQDGIQPSLVLWEYWPPFWHEDEHWHEYQRIEVSRLSPRDLPWVEVCYPSEQSAQLRRQIWQQHLLPFWGARQRLLMQLLPLWLPRQQRIDWTWKDIDDWGWYPGMDTQQFRESDRLGFTMHCQGIYQPLLARYCASAGAEAALRRSWELLHSAQIPMVLFYLPEASLFRQWYSPRTEALIQDQRRRLQQELGIPWLDAREWMPDEVFVDGFHLSRQGAATFTRRLGAEVVARFFEISR